MKVTLSKTLQTTIFEQLEAAYPNEGGGFLLGEVSGEAITITEVTGIENVFEEEEQYHRYAMTPQDWARLEDDADERGLALVGYYHSHPDADPIPSKYDRDHALPGFVYIITAVRAAKADEMRVWRLQEDRTDFDEGELHLE